MTLIRFQFVCWFGGGGRGERRGPAFFLVLWYDMIVITTWKDIFYMVKYGWCGLTVLQVQVYHNSRFIFIYGGGLKAGREWVWYVIHLFHVRTCVAGGGEDARRARVVVVWAVACSVTPVRLISNNSRSIQIRLNQVRVYTVRSMKSVSVARDGWTLVCRRRACCCASGCVRRLSSLFSFSWGTVVV